MNFKEIIFLVNVHPKYCIGYIYIEKYFVSLKFNYNKASWI